MNKTTKALLIAIYLAGGSFATLPDFGFGDMMVESCKSDFIDVDIACSLVDTDSPSSIETKANDVFKIEELDMDRIGIEFTDLCKKILLVTNTNDASMTRVALTKSNSCKIIMQQVGFHIKNYHLAVKMFGLVAKEIISFPIDMTIDDQGIIARASFINSRIKNIADDKKEECWSVYDNCAVPQTVIQRDPSVINIWIDKRARAIEIIKSLFNFNRNRLLVANYDWSLFRKRAVIVLFNMEINKKIREFKKLSIARRVKLFNLIKMEDEKPKQRCEQKYGKGKCLKMEYYAFCYKCEYGTEAYWRTTTTCGCKLAANTSSQDLQFTIRRDVVENPEKFGKTREAVDGPLVASLTASYIRRRILETNDAFFLETIDKFYKRSL